MANIFKSLSSNKSFSSNFEKIFYDKNQVSSISLDIWSPLYLKISQEEKFSFKVYTTYQVTNRDFNIESIANNIYGKASLWWTILLANDEDDPFDFIETVKDDNINYPNSFIKVFTSEGIGKLLSTIPQEKELHSVVRNNK